MYRKRNLKMAKMFASLLLETLVSQLTDTINQLTKFLEPNIEYLSRLAGVSEDDAGLLFDL